MNDETAKHVIDTLTIGTAVATLVGWLPQISALLSIVWLCLRIWESETVREWRGK